MNKVFLLSLSLSQQIRCMKEVNRKMIHDTFYELTTMSKTLVDFNIIDNRIILKIRWFIIQIFCKAID